MRLFLVEDNPDLAQTLIERMGELGHALDWQADGLGASRVLGYERFDLVVLDMGLPSLSGLQVLRRMRARNDATPVLMLTACDHIEDRVAALNAGADDYLLKPFDFREFEARCRALLRRHHGQPGAIIRIGNLVFDDAAHRVILNGSVIELPNREYRLLEILLRRRGEVVSKGDIGNGLFGFGDDVGPNAIELYIGRLRRRLQHAPIKITTVRGVGYLLESVQHGQQRSAA